MERVSRDNVVVIVGVTGAVGVELLRLLETRTWVDTVRGYASRDGAAFQWRGQTVIAKGLVSVRIGFEGGAMWRKRVLTHLLLAFGCRMRLLRGRVWYCLAQEAK